MLRPAESSEITKYPSISWCQVVRRWAIFSNVLASLCSSSCEAIISLRYLEFFFVASNFYKEKMCLLIICIFSLQTAISLLIEDSQTHQLQSTRGENYEYQKKNHILTKRISEKEKVDKWSKDLPWQWLPPQTGPLCRRGEGGEGRRGRCRNTRSSFSNQASWQEEVKIKSRKMESCWRIGPCSHSSFFKDHGLHLRNSLRTRGSLLKIIWRSGRWGISWRVRRGAGLHK